MIDSWGPIIWEYYGGTKGNGLTLQFGRVAGAEGHGRTLGRGPGQDLRRCGQRRETAGVSGSAHFAGGREFEYHNDPNKLPKFAERAWWTTLGDVGYV